MDVIDGGAKNIFLMHLSILEEQFGQENCSPLPQTSRGV